ncbi:MFS transporter [Actinokineospora fastidiosa]|uniref:ABC transport system membrane protein n=1 Tax=Actinokineospora fastidiosa TaxID=1816 RepID=A0A918LDP9_9PSEU|nr:MFS transporter [Actinokineospora fastidiosa]GGS35473.1 putative ABC transport system membrane protein [Actinokineospora fastidiosa]
MSAFRSFPLSVRLLLVNQFGVNTGFYLLVPYLATHLAGTLGLSAAVVGIVLGVRTLSQQGLFLIGGTASDRLGPRRVIIAGCALRTVGFGLFALGESVPVLLAAAVLSGVAGALFNPAVRAYVAVAATEERRAEAFALFNVFAQAGALVGPLLGGVLLLWDFRIAAVSAAVVFAVLTVAQAFALPAREAAEPTGTVLGDWRECLANRRFLAFTIALTGLYTLQNQLYLVLPMEAMRVTGFAGSVAALFIVSTVVSLVFQVRITRALRDRPRGRSIAVGMAVMGAGFLAPALSHLWPALGVPAVLVATLGLAVGVMIAHPFVYDLIPSFGREGLAGTYFGMFYLASGVVAAAANGVIGWATEAGGAWGAAVSAAVGLASAGAVLALHRRGALTMEAAR